MIIRRANLEDAARISYLIKRNTEKVKENNYSATQIRAWKKANTTVTIKRSMKNKIIFCAFENDQLIGTIGLQGNEVVGLYVSYSKRGQGIGRRLLSHLEQYAESKHIYKLVLTATPSAVRFYEANGYQSISKVVVTIDEVDFVETEMHKKL